MPGYQSVINHITGADGLLKKYVHLYKEGMEQDELAAAGSEQTKDESANGEFENALIEVAELYEEAKAIKAGKSAAKKEAAGERASRRNACRTRPSRRNTARCQRKSIRCAPQLM
ncbi:hypothetical protein AB1Y20_019592 [Prymnesium parvum]|uniref:Tubulin-specific chaperone A n=1 Tax=Prymnesium parvum TaxID=97485 RepID=A0AB34JUK2_PRYPA